MSDIKIYGYKWIGIQEVLSKRGINVSIATLRNWHIKYNLPLLRMPNGYPAITGEMVDKWIEIVGVILGRRDMQL